MAILFLRQSYVKPQSFYLSKAHVNECSDCEQPLDDSGFHVVSARAVCFSALNTERPFLCFSLHPKQYPCGRALDIGFLNPTQPLRSFVLFLRQYGDICPK